MEWGRTRMTFDLHGVRGLWLFLRRCEYDTPDSGGPSIM
jgi:hypothetical protein